MDRICLIGNSEDQARSNGGQAIKVRLYRKLIIEHNPDSVFVDLENFKRHPLKILKRIKKEIKNCDRIVLITAARGAKILIPYINRINKKTKKPFVLPLVGISFLHWYLDSKSEEIQAQFFKDTKNISFKPKKRDINLLNKISYILPENQIVADAITNFFGLENVIVINNFRLLENQKNTIKKTDKFRIVYISRVCEEKGILDLVKVVNECIIIDGLNISLDIYGQKVLTDYQLLLFNKYLNSNICYKGMIENSKVLNILPSYDCFVFPTKFLNEGTPGVLSEALISGLPIISSNFNQVDSILCRNKDSLIYENNSSNDLKDCIKKLYLDKKLFKQLSNNALESGKKFTFNFWKEKFYNYVFGEENT